MLGLSQKDLRRDGANYGRKYRVGVSSSKVARPTIKSLGILSRVIDRMPRLVYFYDQIVKSKSGRLCLHSSESQAGGKLLVFGQDQILAKGVERTFRRHAFDRFVVDQGLALGHALAAA